MTTLLRRIGLLWLLLLPAVLSGGCSIYHSARSQLPPGEADKLSLRLEKANETAVHIRESLASEPAGSSFDARVESLAWEYSRRIAAVHDAADSLTTPIEGVSRTIASMHELERTIERVRAAMAEGSADADSLRRDALASLDSGIHEVRVAALTLAIPPHAPRTEPVLTSR